VLFFDDFDGPSLDTSKWVPGLHVWGRNNRGVAPENLSLVSIEDQGRLITVLDTAANGDLYRGQVQGVHAVDSRFPLGDRRRYERVADGTRVGGLVWTRERWGGGRYEVRMKNLPASGGCSCIWNYHQAVGEYTEIDIEMPANGTADGLDWAHWAGLNTYWPDERRINEKKHDLGAAQNDGLFHIYRWDWYDGTNGEPRVEFYLDGRLLHTSTANVPRLPAQLWVGNWPAPWSGDFKYDTQHLYVDWVKITELRSPGRRRPPDVGPR
jgi:Glycosyl hydrolases family 16